jgi:hypothetical protein
MPRTRQTSRIFEARKPKSAVFFVKQNPQKRRDKFPIVIMGNFNIDPCDCLGVMLYNEVNN